LLVLVLNCGSSSLKFKLIETSAEQIEASSDRILAEGLVENIGQDDAKVHFSHDSERITRQKIIPDHQAAIERAIELLQTETHLLDSTEDLDAVGHRVVHGGELFSESVIIDEQVEKQIEECIPFAPLHNPHNLAGIRAVREAFPDICQVAAFDTGVHQSLPEKAYRYALPERYYSEHGIRRYGFHGLSHRYLRLQCRKTLNKGYDEINVITCHLGNGASLAAFDGFEVQDTSMGFTPLEGLVMGSRCGDIDPAVVTYIMSLEDYSREEIDQLLNCESGLLGLSGETNDMRTIREKMEEGHERCRLAVEVFCHRLKKYISAYQGLLNGAHAVVFSGGIGENSCEVRRRACINLENIGIKLDNNKNKQLKGSEGSFSTPDSPTKLMVIPTNEELMIARDTIECIES